MARQGKINIVITDAGKIIVSGDGQIMPVEFVMACELFKMSCLGFRSGGAKGLSDDINARIEESLKKK